MPENVNIKANHIINDLLLGKRMRTLTIKQTLQYLTAIFIAGIGFVAQQYFLFGA